MKKYLVRYYSNGSWYGTHIHASSFNDAKLICQRHNLQLDGEYKFSLRGYFGSIAAFIFNLKAKRQEGER